MSDPQQEALALLSEHGTYVRDAKHCHLYEVNGARVGIPKTPSDKRAWSNTLAAIRRALPTPEEQTMNTPDPKPIHFAIAASAVKVVREQTKRLVINKPLLWTLLDRAGAEIPDGAVMNFDADGWVTVEWVEREEAFEE